MEKITGIYSITNNITGKKYVGKSIDITKRWGQHMTMLEAKEHHSKKLQYSWNKHGIENFTFKIEEECTDSDLNSKEIHYIELYDCVSNGYNVMNPRCTEKYKCEKVLKEPEKPFKDMSISELIEYRDNNGLGVNVEFEFGRGFSINTDNQAFIDNLELGGFIYSLGFLIAKDGRLIYKNNVVIETFEDLRKELRIGDRVWRRIKKDIELHDIIRKIKYKKSNCLVINPFIISNNDNIQFIKFIAFKDLWKEVLNEYDFALLEKQFK